MPATDALAAEALLNDLSSLAVRNTATLRGVRRTYSKTWKRESPQFVLGVARRLSASGYRWIGCELIRNHPAAFAALNDRVVAQFAIGLNSWDSGDAFARILSGPAWARGYVSDALIEKWSRSRDRWLRRAAVVSTVALNMRGDGGQGDSRRTLAICRSLAADNDDMVQKAISWALRALIAHDAAAVAKFTVTHREQLSSRVKREVSNKMRIGLKNPRQAKRSN
jgi:3-methyladenine DNA glycosylase AlkD